MKKIATLTTAILLAACGGDIAQASDDAEVSASSASSVALTGDTIEIGMYGVGETYFGPEEVTARRGDVLRFKLESGVHNASFPAQENPAGVELPEPSPYLQVPGQTWDLTVELPAGEYYYHCDPHAALGMIGHLTVVD